MGWWDGWRWENEKVGRNSTVLKVWQKFQSKVLEKFAEPVASLQVELDAQTSRKLSFASMVDAAVRGQNRATRGGT